MNEATRSRAPFPADCWVDVSVTAGLQSVTYRLGPFSLAQAGRVKRREQQRLRDGAEFNEKHHPLELMRDPEAVIDVRVSQAPRKATNAQLAAEYAGRLVRLQAALPRRIGPDVA